MRPLSKPSARRPSPRARVEIYTWRTCPFCIRAKWRLRRHGVACEEHRIGGDTRARARMTERAGGRSTLPQIFINGRGIGGCDELRELDRSGELAPLLAEPPPAAGGRAAS